MIWVSYSWCVVCRCLSDERCCVRGVLWDDRTLPVTVSEAANAYPTSTPVMVRVTAHTAQDETKHSRCTGPGADLGGRESENQLQQWRQRLLTVWQVPTDFVRYMILLLLEAPLGMLNTKRRHQSPEWMSLNHVSCFIQGEIVGFQILLDSLHPRSTRVSRWSSPVLQKRSC